MKAKADLRFMVGIEDTNRGALRPKESAELSSDGTRMGAQGERAMVPWWKRLIYSLVSVALGAGISGAWVAAQETIAQSHGRISAMGLLTAILFFDSWVLLLSLPGWVVAIPVVLLVRNIRGWRFWMYWGLGIAFGPALIYAVSVYSAFREQNFESSAMGSVSSVAMAGAVSGLTALFYLLLLRRGQMEPCEEPSETVV